MSDRQNDAVLRLAAKYSLEEGLGLDYYAHRQSGKYLVTKAGIERIAAAEGIQFHTPLLTVCPDRIIVSGDISNGKADHDAYRLHWTTGEARFDGKAVEGSHSAAMAEKRWKARGVLALVVEPGEVVYGEDEFDDDFLKGSKKAQDEKKPVFRIPERSPAQAPDGSSSPGSSSWRDCVAAVSRMCGIPMDTRFPGTGKYDSDLDQMLLKAHGWFDGDQGRRGVFTHNTHPKGMPTWDKMNALNEKWAGTTLDKLRKTVACLEEGQGITLEYDNYANGKSEWHSVNLRPLGQTERPTSGPEDDYDQQPLPEDVPF